MHTKLILALLAVPALSLADTAPKKAPPPTKEAPADKAPAPPAPPPEVKATVDAFKGNWKFDTTMTATGMPGMDKPFASKMTFNCKPVAGNTAVACDAKSKTPMGPYEGLFVVAYDPYSKGVHFMSITNMHEVHDHVCQWKGTSELTCATYKGGMGPTGDEITEEISMKFDKNTVAFTSKSKMVKGGATMVFEGKGKK